MVTAIFTLVGVVVGALSAAALYELQLRAMPRACPQCGRHHP